MQGKHSVVVSGCSKGLGLSIAEVLICEGFHVFGSIRKQEDADRLSKQFGASFTPLIMDVTDEVSVQQAAEKVRDELKGRTLYGLINNAGYCQPAPFLHQPLSDFKYTISANLTGVFIVSQAFLPQLGADKELIGQPGRIINISSVQGKYGTPFMAAYTASKHGVEGLSECMRRELIPYGIDVVIVAPGFVKTDIFDIQVGKVVGPYIATAYAEPFCKWLKFLHWSTQEDRAHDPEVVAREILLALTAESPKTRYSPIANRLQNWTIPLSLPTRWVDERMSKGLGLKDIDLSAIQSKLKAGSSPRIPAFREPFDQAKLPKEYQQVYRQYLDRKVTPNAKSAA